MDGKALAVKMQDQLQEKVARLKEKEWIVPGLVVIMVGDNPASQVYVRNKERAAKKAGFHSQTVNLSESISEEELIEVIERYNQDPLFHGILVQLPLPNHINEMRILLAVDPKKDVDGFHPMNTGNLWNGRRQMVPCTPAGIMEILREYNVELEGKTAVIPASDLTKSAADAAKPNAGNDIVKPADKTVVANPDALTPEEKKAIEDKVKAVNPGSTVVVDDKGNATVTTSEGKTAVIPSTDLTKSAADAAKPNAGDDIVKPADKTVVANPDKLTDAEKKAIEDKVKAVNPGSTVVVDDKGNATVTTPAGKTAVIPASDLTKSASDAAKPNAGDDIVKPADKTVVANPDKLTDAEKKAIEDKVKAVNPGSTVVVDDKGNATVAKGDGTVLNIPALDLVIPADDLVDAAKNTAVKTPAIRTLVADKEKLTDAEKAAVKKAIEAVNPGATVVVDDKGNATVTLDGNTVSIAKDQLMKLLQKLKLLRKKKFCL